MQQVGESTFVVSLPKGWVVERGIHKGDFVSITEEEDGSIRIYSGINKKGQGHLRCSISADKCSRPGLLTRMVAGAYVLGVENCTVFSKNSVSQQHKDELRTIAKKLNGMNVVEETPRKVVLQSFVNPMTYSVEGLLRRLFIITSSMEEMAYRVLKENRPDLIVQVIEMEDDVDSFYRLVVRQLTLASKDKVVAKAIGIRASSELLTFRLVAELLEKIGDLIEGLAKEILTLQRIDPAWNEITAEVYRLMESSIKILDVTFQAHFGEDAILANEVIDLSLVLASKESNLTNRIFELVRKRGPLANNIASIEGVIGARYVISKMSEIADRCCTIAEITVDRSIEIPNELCTTVVTRDETLQTLPSRLQGPNLAETSFP